MVLLSGEQFEGFFANFELKFWSVILVCFIAQTISGQNMKSFCDIQLSAKTPYDPKAESLIVIRAGPKLKMRRNEDQILKPVDAEVKAEVC